MTYLLLFLGTLVEPDVVLIAAAFLAHRGRLDLVAVILICAAASLAANQFWFWLARLRGREFFERKRQTDRRYQLIHGWLQRRGTLLIPASRFLYGFRAAIPAAYGASGASPLKFTWLDTPSAAVWSVAVGLAGYAFGDTLDRVISNVQHYETAVVAALVVIAATVAYRRRSGLVVVIGAVRRPAEAGGRAILRLFLLVRHVGRLLVVSPHGRLAVMAAAMGILNVVSATFGTRIWHFESLVDWLPFEVTHGSRALMLLAGLGLIYLGRGLSRRKRLAWSLALALAGVSALVHIGHHGGVLRAITALVFGAELWRQRHRFHARTDPARLRHAAVALPVLALAVTAYGFVGLLEFTPLPPGVGSALRTVWLMTGFQDVPLYGATAASFVWSLRLLGLVSAGYVLTAALAPVALRGPGTLVDRSHLDRLAWEYGHDSLSYFAKQPDKRHFAVDDRAFLGFRLTHRVAIVAGDPVGEDGAVQSLIGAFVRHCRTNDWIPVFYETSDRYLEAYRSQGLRWFTIGQEAVLDLPAWSMSGGAVAKARQFVNKVRREAPDLRATEYRPATRSPETDSQLEEISAEWLATKAGGEMGFNLGVFSVEDLADKRTILAQRADGTIEAFVTWLPYRAGHAVVIDVMRHRNAAQPGVMDFLIAESALLFKKEGLQSLSLAVAPLANTVDPSSVYDHGVRLVFDHLSSVYGYRSLFQFKKKFGPEWQARHLVFPRADLLGRIAYALVRVHYSHG